MIVPLIMIAIVFVSPRSYVSSIPGLSEKLSSETDIATDSTMLRLLQFVDRDYLINLGTDTGERIAQDHAIMENYARRGLTGEGYLQVRVISAKAGNRPERQRLRYLHFRSVRRPGGHLDCDRLSRDYPRCRAGCPAAHWSIWLGRATRWAVFFRSQYLHDGVQLRTRSIHRAQHVPARPG